ncbi:MAG: WD40 repeat domain-containing protein, partial [Saprospiraceae bacterium]|nr:WD40 repeat domain-containing protein [Saprospiraceae bacterium]
MKAFVLIVLACLVLDVQAQKPRLVVPIGHTSGVYWASFSLDGKTVRTSSPDGVTLLWDLDGKELVEESGDISSVFQSPYSPDGKSFLKVIEDTVKLLDFSGRELQVFYTAHTKWFGFSPNGKIVFTGSPDGLIKQWDLSGRLLNTCKLSENQIAYMDFSPDTKLVLTANGNKTATLWDLSGRLLQTFTGHADQVFDAAFSPDGKSLLVGGFQGGKRWDLTGRGCENVNGYTGGVSAVAFSPDGRLVLTGSTDETFKLFDVTGNLQHVFKGGDSVTNHAIIAFSPDGRRVLTNGDHNTLQLRELSAAKPPRTLVGHKNQVNSATFSPDGKTILTADKDKTVILWDETGTLLQQFDQLSGVAVFSPDGKAMIAGSEDGIPTLFDLTGQELRNLGPSEESCFVCDYASIVCSPDGKYVLTTNGFNSDARLWNMSGGQIRTFGNGDYATQGHTESVFAASFSPDGKKVVTCGKDYSVKIWDVASDTVLATLIALDSTDWVVTTPSGLFDASPGAMKLLYFVVGKYLEVVELEQLKERYYEPGLLSKIMGFSNEPLLEAVAFDSVPLFPSVRLNLDTAKNNLHILLTPRSGGVGKVSVFINDKEIIEDANPLLRGQERRDTAITVELAKYARYFLLDSLNTVSIRAYNQAGWLKSAAQSVEY